MAILILLVVGLIALTKVWSLFAFSKMSVELKINQTRVFPGESIRLEILAKNSKFLPVWLQVNALMSSSCFVSDKKTGESSFLLWFQKTIFIWNLKALNRGCYTMGQHRIIVSDLFGFFPRQKTRQDPVDVIVYPKIIPIRPFSMPEHNFFGFPGAKSPVQDPVYILGTREYQSFTPVKLIHWNASAKVGKLQEKVCEPSVQEKLLIVVDVDLFHAHGAKLEFERMLEAAASMAVYFESRGNAVGFMTNAVIKGKTSDFIPLSRNRQSLSLILETIARMEMRPAGRLSDIFHHHISVLWGINCIFCSYSIDDSMLKMKHFYAHKRIAIKYFVSTMGELENKTDLIYDTIQPIDTICI